MNDPWGSTTVKDDTDRLRPEWAREVNATPPAFEGPVIEAPAGPNLEPKPQVRSVRGARGAMVVALALAAGFAGGKLGSTEAPARAPAAAPVRSTPQATSPAGAVVPSNGDLAALYRSVAPSVVQVVSRSGGEGGSGSGVVIDAGGTILTNNHVVAGDNVQVRLSDGRRLEGTVAGRDPQWDLAVVRLTGAPAGLVAARLGDSSQVVPGQTVVAIGAPFGLAGSLTSGVVSAINRAFGGGNGSPPMRGLIQTDASINPGNSGGPLFNLAGEVIGITTAIESPVRGSVGVGFAVPINQAQAALPALVKGETFEHAFLGIQGDENDADGGVTVEAITPGSSVASSGLRVGDIITAIGGTPVSSVDELARALERFRVGEKVALSVRRGTETITITVTLKAYNGG